MNLCARMPDAIAFSTIALALSFVKSADAFPSNTQQIEPYENFWNPELVVPGINKHLSNVPSTDNAELLAESSPYPSIHSTDFSTPDAKIQCGAKNMTLRISKLGSSPLHVNTNDSWVSVFHKVPQCSSRKSRHRRFSPPHFGCAVSKGGPATFPVRVAGTPLVIGCPYPPLKPTVECSTALQLRLGGVSADKLKVKVMRYWYPLMVICRWCGFTMELKAGALSIKAPFRGTCTETKDGVHSISLRSGDTEMVFSCSPPVYPPWPYPTYPPWLPAPKPTLPPAPKPVYPWQNVPYHFHTTTPAPVYPPWPFPTAPPSPVYPPWPFPTAPPSPVYPPWPFPTPPPSPVYPPWPFPTPPPSPVYPPWPFPTPPPSPVYPPWPFPTPPPSPVYPPWPFPAPPTPMPTAHAHQAAPSWPVSQAATVLPHWHDQDSQGKVTYENPEPQATVQLDASNGGQVGT